MLVKFKIAKLEPNELYAKLRKTKTTIKQLANYMQVPLNRIRFINKHGAKGPVAYDYLDAIKHLQ